MLIKFKKLHEDAKVPTYATEGAAAFDIYAIESLRIGTQGIAVRTGIALEIPEGYEIQIRPRSGLALQGLVVVNSPGTIDSDYRGELKVILRGSYDDVTFVVSTGDRIAQGVLAPVTKATFQEVTELSDTKRGDGGFGSTGR